MEKVSRNQIVYRRTSRNQMSQVKYISARGNLFSFYKPRSKELAQKTFFIVLGFKAETFLLEIHLTKYIQIYNL